MGKTIFHFASWWQGLIYSYECASQSSCAQMFYHRCGIEEAKTTSLVISYNLLMKMLNDTSLTHPTTFLNLALLFQRVNR